MKCIKCRKEIPDGSLYCNHCGKKQTATKSRVHKRAHGTGTIIQDKRYRKSWIAYAPSSRYRKTRTYIGAYETRRDAQDALEKFISEGRPELYNATLADIYQRWSAVHFQRVGESAVNLYKSMWKHFAPIQDMKIRDIRTAHLQDIVNAGKSKSSCEILRTLAYMLCNFAAENDIVQKNYAEFIRIPSFEQKQKQIFTPGEIAVLWEHAENRDVQMILFMIYTGLRIGELLSLRIPDIHLDEDYLIGGEKTKAGKNRVIPIPSSIPELKGFVRSWISDSENAERLFSDTDQQWRKKFYLALEDCAIQSMTESRRLTPHSTRHTFASISSQAGIRPEHLRKIIGHSSFQTTAEIYIHQNIDALKEEMNKIRK